MDLKLKKARPAHILRSDRTFGLLACEKGQRACSSGPNDLYLSGLFPQVVPGTAVLLNFPHEAGLEILLD